MKELEKKLICKAAMDLETGHHLIYERSGNEILMINEVLEMLATPDELMSDRQKEIYEEYRLCTDYEYWKEKNNE